MLRHQGGETVKAGFYFNCATWEISTLSGHGGVLAGSADTRFLRMPLPLLLAAAPMMGAAFAMFLPFIGIAMVLDFVARKAWKVAREAVHGSVVAVSPRTRTGEAYFTGSSERNDKGSQEDAEAAARLAELERKVEDTEKAGR